MGSSLMFWIYINVDVGKTAVCDMGSRARLVKEWDTMVGGRLIMELCCIFLPWKLDGFLKSGNTSAD
jgi:hypothetical protein